MRPNPSKRPQPRYLFEEKIATFANFGMGVMRLEVKDGPPQKFVVNDAFSQIEVVQKGPADICLAFGAADHPRSLSHLPEATECLRHRLDIGMRMTFQECNAIPYHRYSEPAWNFGNVFVSPRHFDA
ncbi:hypothetical protein K443DRAFT_8679 [Laccaria amethystina LaAM-08-1]|uniref:Uncharacterized protein n=1 Tax=Laccaria amethystina LaAM-08-1 TaxID=1095629 RepID=A0A0C9XC59_9AGAR|nr:hypothetical protein K443DRAFT_8679 [Laccaria amethystina LaAM-08-1]